MTQTDSGWAKFAWGKIYGQWICGAVIVAYDNVKFDAKNTLELIQEIKLSTFCAPPTIFRFLIKEDISKQIQQEDAHYVKQNNIIRKTSLK